METPVYSHKMDQQQQREQHLPAQWTPVDQEIIEDLLFLEPVSAHAPPPGTVALGPQPLAHMQYIYDECTQQQQEQEQEDLVMSPMSQPVMFDGTGGAAVHPRAHSHSHSRFEPRVELMAQGLSPGGMSSGAGSSAEEVRKAKHREVQRRFMLRKKAQIKRTKQFANELEMKYNVLKLSTENDRLQTENESLEANIAERGSGMTFISKPRVEAVLEDQLKMVREHFEPITETEWSDLLQKNIDDYEITSREPDYVSTGVTVLGWSDRRKQENSSLKFIISKQFPFLNAADFMNTTWEKLWLQETHSALFTSAVTIKVQILQHINEDAIVMHRAMFNPQTNGIVHTVETLCRVRHGMDYIVFLRSPERSPVKQCVADLYDWVQIWTSLVFTPMPSRHHGVSGTMFRYGGMLRNFSAPEVKYWLMEMLWVVLRFESVMVSPVFTLLPEQPPSAASSPG